MDIVKAARLIIDLDEHRQGPGDRDSARARRERARFNGAMSVWEALTGLEGDDALNRADDIVEQALAARRNRRDVEDPRSLVEVIGDETDAIEGGSSLIVTGRRYQ
jgi:hypothetical protein